MIYQSTRNDGLTVSSAQAILDGMAGDGGLYSPASFSDISLDWRALLPLSTRDMATRILAALLPSFSEAEMGELVRRAYEGKFETEDLTPTVRVGEDTVLELFRGPTSAFKDVALSMLPLLMTAAREKCGVSDEILILTATSGDTGKAAMEGFANVPGTRILVFYPYGGVSPVQQAQMVTQEGSNVRVCAVRGNFDDCQRGVKEAFAKYNQSADAASSRMLSSANSINIGRLVPQVVYYFSAYAQLLRDGKLHFGDKVDFVVPTGNFGDILAGYLAREMGLPVGRLVCASNANNVLTDFITTGVYNRCRPFLKTSSPSMDILVSSNLERMLFYATGGDTDEVASLMRSLSRDGSYTLTGSALEAIQSVFAAGCCTEDEVTAAISQLWHNHRWLSDTHTAVGFAVLDKYRGSASFTGNPCVVLSTASPFKFPAAVLSAIGGTPSDDEFETALRLSELTQIPVPENIANLRHKPMLHHDVVNIEDVVSYALS